MIYLSQYRTHQSVEGLENSVGNHIKDNYSKLTKSDRMVLNCLKEYAKHKLGACHVKAETIAENTFTSRSTVMRSLKKLTTLGIIEKINRTKMNGIMGASIYKVMNYDDTAILKQRDTAEEVNDTAVHEPKKSAEYINSLGSLKSFKTSTINNIYINAYAHEEFLNEWQLTLIELLNSFKIDKILGEEFNKVIAATEITNAKEFHMVKDIIINMAKDLQSGRLSVDTTLRAIYKGAYNNKVEREVLPQVATVQDEPVRKKAPFYNWLDEREVVN